LGHSFLPSLFQRIFSVTVSPISLRTIRQLPSAQPGQPPADPAGERGRAIDVDSSPGGQGCGSAEWSGGSANHTAALRNDTRSLRQRRVEESGAHFSFMGANCVRMTCGCLGFHLTKSASCRKLYSVPAVNLRSQHRSARSQTETQLAAPCLHVAEPRLETAGR
jgi:hypothetical protein